MGVEPQTQVILPFLLLMKKGLFIPDEILEIEELNNTECMVLAVYWYYTVEGSLHCCTLTNKDVCKKARIKEERGLRKIKKHLKDLGLIRTDGGIRVYYTGVRGDKIGSKG